MRENRSKEGARNKERESETYLNCLSHGHMTREFLIRIFDFENLIHDTVFLSVIEPSNEREAAKFPV